MVLRPGTLARVAMTAAALLGVALTACEPAAPPPTRPGTKRMVLLGDSVPNWLIRDGSTGVPADEVTLVNGTLPACDGAKGNPPARSRTGEIVPTTAGCDKGWPAMYPPHLTIRADVAVLMTSKHAMLDHLLDGTWRHPCHTPARSWYQSDMTARLQYLKTKADRVVLVLPAWPGSNSGWIMPADYVKRADCVRSVLRAAAKAAGVATVDFGAYLCPTGASSCKPWRLGDGIHIDKSRAPSALGFIVHSSLPPASSSLPPANTTPPPATSFEPADDQAPNQSISAGGRSGTLAVPDGQPR